MHVALRPSSAILHVSILSGHDLASSRQSVKYKQQRVARQRSMDSNGKEAVKSILFGRCGC